VPLSEDGLFCVEPNPRGSYGAGRRRHNGQPARTSVWRLRDILAGVDVVEKNQIERVGRQPARPGPAWSSYGPGVMTMFVVTQTSPFPCAVAGVAIANWQRELLRRELESRPVDDARLGASVMTSRRSTPKSSAIDFIRKV